jgi:subtilisin-like proprotein convertase family protein
MRRGAAASLVLVVTALLVRVPIRAQVAPPRAATEKGTDRTANFDIRIAAPQRAALLQRLGRGEPGAGRGRLQQASDALAALRADLPAAAATISPFTGGAELVRNPRGALTPPAPEASSAAIVAAFLESHSALYGLSPADVATLRFRGESVNRGNGLRMLRADQTINGIPVFQSDARFIVDRDGRLIRTVGRLVSQGAADGADTTPAIPAAAALVNAMRSVGIEIAASDVSAVVQNGTERLSVANARVTDAATSRLVYFPLAPGVLVLAHEQVTFTDGPGDYLTLVDATTGTLLWRKNLRNYQSTQPARFSVYVQPDGVTPADSPAPHSPTTPAPGSGTQHPAIARTIVSMGSAQDLIASPTGWIPDGGTTTTGNNVDACLDRIVGGSSTNSCDAGALDNDGRPVGNPDTSGNDRDFLGNAVRNFDYTPPPVGGDPNAGDTPTGTAAVQDAFRRGAVTQTFYVTNWYHDRLFALGFDEAAGNFQTVNFSGQGAGGDAIRADVQDGAENNNATFSTPPDGVAPRMQLHRFTFPTLDRDGALDAEIVIHELTHGLSNRLVGNGAGLIWGVGQGLGEGWSDFYALSLLNNTQADDPNGAYASAAYATYGLGGLTDNYTYGIRRFPYSTDNTINPLTWADVDGVTANYSGGIPISPIGFEQGGAFEVHNVGEVWALTLWEVRSRVIADPAGANGSVPAGNQTMLQLVTDALKMTPGDPSFIEARDALIDADCATNACANERWIWEGFADRGLGYGAVAPLAKAGLIGLGNVGTGPSSELPGLEVAGITIDDSLGNNNGAIDPGEPFRLTVQLRNAWRGTAFNVPGATATLSSTTPGITIFDGASTYPAIAAGGTAQGDTFLLRAGPGLACGQSIALTLQITSSLGTVSTTVTRRVGLASGTAAPVTFTRTHSPGLPIPDDTFTGVSSTLSVPDDLEIADLDFRVDNIQHTFVGDLTVLLRAPNGYGTDLIFLIGGLTDGGPGDNLIDTVIDEAATEELFLALGAQAPYTGSWRPAFNSPSLELAGWLPDSIGQLSRLNGLSTRGDWSVLAVDTFPADAGTLNSWSLVVTPRSFTCSAFTDVIPPLTTVSLTPPAPTGSGGWYVSPVTVAVSANDGPAGTIAETRCAVDPAVTPATFAELPPGCALGGAGAPVGGDGPHTVYAASLDGSGNAGIPTSAAFRIDATPPVLACAVPAPRLGLNQAGAVVTATLTDATSGPASATASAPADTTSLGSRTVTITGSDLAGHAASIVCPYTVNVIPTVTITGPTADPTLSATTYFLPILGTASSDTAITTVTWTNDRGGSGTAKGTNAWMVPVVGLQAGLNVITVAATEADGDVGSATLTVTFDTLTQHLAEGSTGSFFSTELALANPNASAANVELAFLKQDGSRIVRDLTLAPTSRSTIALGSIPELDATPVSITLTSPDRLPIGVERTMLWDATGYGGHGEGAVGQPRRTWVFAEGSQGFFHTYLLLLNPNAEATTVTLTFLPEAEPAVVRTYDLPPVSRLVVDASTVPELIDRSFGTSISATRPILAERSMYFGDTPARLFAGGHASTGAADPSTTWFFAEGATGSYFDTYVLLANPGTSPARATLRYLLDSGITITQERTVAPNTRLTVDVEHSDPQLASAAFATQVASDVPIVAERSMYWVGEPGPWTEAHSTTGVIAPGTRWLLAEGRAGGAMGFQSYILLANPDAAAAEVRITYLKADGTTVVRTHVVAPTSRHNVNAGAVPELADQSFGALVEVTNGVGIVVERSMYWNSGGIVWAGGTNVAAMRVP